MQISKQQKRLIFFLTVVLVAIFICVTLQKKKTSSNKSNDYVADVHRDKDSKNPSKSDPSKVKVENSFSNQPLKEEPSNPENESSIPEQSIETDRISDLPQNENNRDSTEVQKEPIFIKLEQQKSFLRMASVLLLQASIFPTYTL
ncbi:hypothetical protein [Bacillus sp. 123MFChir2]|uniref:hypothetical protein n=1 Tax=Bacillus sp. 123MFChir2 TaxID=1169144 RepID=UPI00036FE19B|nr:hypothetical protein [Bacillus sp. 123MFChir2]